MLFRVLLTSTVFGLVLSTPLQAITLEEATYTAIENSPTVRQAIAKYRESSQDIAITKSSGYYPSVDLSAGMGHETTYADDTTPEDISLTRREFALSLTQPIFNGFSTKYEVRRLTSEAESDRWAALIQVENTALSVAESFSNVLRYRELLSLADLNLQTHQRIYEQIKLKSDTGVGRQSDLSQITARLAKAHANELAAQNNLRDAESNYKDVVGELPPEEMIYPIPDRDLLPKNLDDAIQQSLAKNPAVEGSKWDVDATENYEHSVDSDKYPSINFVLERSWNNNMDGVEGPDADLLAMVRLEYNLYSGGSFKHSKEVAVQQTMQASEIRRQTIRDTELTVRLAWAAYTATVGQKEHIKQYVIATKESQLAYEKQFRLGRRTLLDVLDSENELFQARQDYVNADYDELFSEFRLFNAKGELMRAFRIYRPSVLGFSDEFDEDAPVSDSSSSAIEELKSAESTVQPEKSQENSEVDSSQSNATSNESGQDTQTKTPSSESNSAKATTEDELFIDKEDGAGTW